MEFHEFTPLLTCHIVKSTMEITALKTTYWSMITESLDINHFIIEFNTLMTADKRSETNWHMRRVTGNDNDYHKYRIQPYQEEKLNTIPTSQLSATISRRTYNQWCNHTPGSAIPRTERGLQLSTFATTFLQFKQSPSTAIVVHTDNSSNLNQAGGPWKQQR